MHLFFLRIFILCGSLRTKIIWIYLFFMRICTLFGPWCHPFVCYQVPMNISFYENMHYVWTLMPPFCLISSTKVCLMYIWPFDLVQDSVGLRWRFSEMSRTGHCIFMPGTSPSPLLRRGGRLPAAWHVFQQHSMRQCGQLFTW
jgi:hypothetical protein